MNLLNCSLLSDFFSLEITQSPQNINIKMQFFNPDYYSTKNHPQTIPLLYQHLPQIFQHKCFNDKKYSFLTEVKNTEIAHLFEHLILEYLAQFQSLNHQLAVYKGETTWNWTEDSPGIFHINISLDSQDTNIFLGALGQSLNLLQKIFA